MTKTSSVNLKNWSKKFFRKEIFSPGSGPAVQAAPEEVAFIQRAMQLKKGNHVLDLCCGTGRHSLLLARRGLSVLGVDSTDAYLKEARKQGRKIKNVEFIKADMRRISFGAQFDAALNLWTSFGYFLNPNDDLKTLKCVFKALKPGGRFLIDIINADFLRKYDRPKFWELRSDGSYRLEDFKMHEGRDPRYTNTWTVLQPGRHPVSATLFVRGYNARRLKGLLRQSGLVPVKLWGSLTGERFSNADSSRLVILSRKP